MTLFVDSSAFYAAVDRSDRSHARVTTVLGSGEPLLTTDHVLVESWLLIRSRLGFAIAERFWELLRAGAASIESVTLVDLESAWASGQSFADQTFSLVDRTSFAVMQRLGVLRAASLDDDFAVFRFGAKRERVFEVVR